MHDRESIRQALGRFLEEETGEKPADLDDAKGLREGLGLDSVDVVSIVLQIERHYRVRLSQEELAKLTTVGDMLDLLQAKLAAGPQSSAA
jgi:acyl carrier protein